MLRAIGRFFKRDWFLKLFSILLASLLWLTISSDDNGVLDLTIPIDFRGIPTDMETTGETATEVHLRLRGSRNLLNNMPPSDVTAVISLAGEAPGDKIVGLNEANVQTPGGVEILRYDPPRVLFRLERTMERTIPVIPNVEGVPAEGFLRRETIVTPATVLIEGPESRLRPLEALSTLSVNIEGADADVTQMVELNVRTIDPLIRLPSLSPHEVVVEIRESPVESTFRVLKDPLLDEGDWIVQPDEIMVRISGPPSRLGTFDPTGLVFTVDTVELDPGFRHRVQPEVTGLETDFLVTGVDPPTVEVFQSEP